MGKVENLESTGGPAMGPFVARHVGPDAGEIDAMLQALGAASLDELIEASVPRSIRQSSPLELPRALTEPEALSRLAELASMNELKRSLIGMGYYGTHTPSVLLRNLFENPGWYTAYTPYQAEISQGRLEALLNWQQAVVDLTGMELANASLLDEATAAAEAMTLAHRSAKSQAEAFFVDADTHPQTKAVLRTRAEPLAIALIEGDPIADLKADEVFGALLSYPGSSGEIRDLAPAVEKLHGVGAIAAVASDLLALCLLEAPGKWGADIVLGSAQRFGVPMGMGGPHAAFFATKDAMKRSIPGRIIGVSQDARGNPALRMALQTREQHIRREKATSNICTAQVLLAVMAGMYAVWHGALGLKAIASGVHDLTADLAGRLDKAGIERVNGHFFDTLTLAYPGTAETVRKAAEDAGFNLRPIDADHLALSLDETVTLAEIDQLARILGAGAKGKPALGLPEALTRRTPFLTHPVFKTHRSETQMLRYLRRLQLKDIALDRSMIPLGSCTMKLNAATEMMPVSMAGFAHIHPFAPADQTKGYQQLFQDLEDWLAAITGFAAISLQPNAGSQGEYTGLLTIRAFHRSKGEAHRDVCLIPSSAHGTNPASAVMAGMKVVVVACDDQGNVDLADLTAKAEANAERLAALMITYPSTHGVFEEGVKKVCAVVHQHGGQVYLDGANLNALVGLCRPAELGADVSHMNLHKTFCIPHGGGGPGMGPIGVQAHLAPFLPGHPVTGGGGKQSLGAVSAAAYGSPSILPITWAYIAMMGADGLRHATEVAILNANYITWRLRDHFPIVYAGRGGHVAHECIIDFRTIKQETGISSEDVAKRLVDYGFHAPTMSWPVPETMMIEPTESEHKAELDRFVDAMVMIREEIRMVERGELDRADNPLKHAPHTADLLLEEWTRGYDKKRAFTPLSGNPADKYWPPVARVDNVYGDRHLVCTCPPVDDYAEAAE